MISIGSSIQSPGDLQAARPVKKHIGIEGPRPQLLELRTESGPVYVCPSQWQRMRLQWTFRHFHVLPPELLSRSDKRLIEKLIRSATVRPDLPVASDTILGVVEKASTKSSAATYRVAPPRSESAAAQTMPSTPRVPDVSRLEQIFRQTPRIQYADSTGSGAILRPDPIAPKKQLTSEPPVDQVPWSVLKLRLGQWGAIGILCAMCLAMIFARIYGLSLFPSTDQARNTANISAPTAQATSDIKPESPLPLATTPVQLSLATSPIQVLLAPTPRMRYWVAPLPATVDHPTPRDTTLPLAGLPHAREQDVSSTHSTDATSEPAAIVPSGSSERLFVSELPQGHFAYPVVADRNLVGVLQLKALIGTDGSVKEVTVLSGNPKLAEAGMRAVRHWHYSPYQSPNGPVEVETQIKMNFFGQDAVSITSVANTPASQVK